MNKAELIDVLTDKLGSDRRSATAAVENVVDTIVRAVHKGDSVTITGFGVFEQRRRAARVARNPRTGETVKVKPTSVPAFPAEGPAVKRGVVAGGAKKVAVKKAAKKAVARKAVKKAVVKKAAKRAVARKAVKKAVVKKAAKRAVARKAVKKAAVKKAVKRSVAKKAVKKAATKRSPAKKATARPGRR
jgi:DNA-binding protein HU-beta